MLANKEFCDAKPMRQRINHTNSTHLYISSYCITCHAIQTPLRMGGYLNKSPM